MFRTFSLQKRANTVLELIEKNKHRSASKRLRRLRELTWEARSRKSIESLVTEVYALVGEASFATMGKIPYPVQIMAAIRLFDGQIVEMQTGEGKTLTVTLPVVLQAIRGRGCHVVTANDYLASRDAAEMGKIYHELGLSCGCVVEAMQDEERREAYACDITYGTAAQFGFDFLRDRLKRGTHSPYDDDHVQPGHSRGANEVQRGQFCAIIDEADSVLIDDAVTPLLIGLAQESSLSTQGMFHWSRNMARKLREHHDFIYEHDKRRAVLTEAGCHRVLLSAKPAALDVFHVQHFYEHVETALAADDLLIKDIDYVINDGEIVIVDESTGRKMPGRKWQRGLHQAVETKEQLETTDETIHAAQITVQSYFRQYQYLSGMTGTALPSRREFRRVYRLPVNRIPTHRPCRRVGLQPRIFRTMLAKWNAIVEEILNVRHQGRAILIGTPSVSESESLAKILTSRNVNHQVLNAHQDEQESQIVSQAGRGGQVTIATNMAGRGTDILIDDAVRKAGGLHVIATAMHSSARIDRQLIGRGARQGDPGSFQFFLSLEDSLLTVFQLRFQRRLRRIATAKGPAELKGSWLKVFRRAQRIHESRQTKQRRQLLKAEHQRTESALKMGLDPFIEANQED